MQDLSITIIQSDLVWRDPESNLHHFEKLIDGIKEPTDLIILPEMFTTGFTVQPQSLAEKIKSRTLKWMFCKATDKKCAVMGSYIIEEDGNFYNRLYMILPNGRSYYYDKRHLFRMAGEDKHFTQGNEKVVFRLKGWRISPMICYDLRFPVWCRNDYKNGEYAFDLQVFVANWPEIRNQAWKTLLAARAVENQAYVAGVNRIGADGNGILHSGDSMVVDPWGTQLSKTLPNQESVETITLSGSKLQEYRKNFAFALDWDGFILD